MEVGPAIEYCICGHAKVAHQQLGASFPGRCLRDGCLCSRRSTAKFLVVYAGSYEAIVSVQYTEGGAYYEVSPDAVSVRSWNGRNGAKFPWLDFSTAVAAYRAVEEILDDVRLGLL